MSCPKQRCGIKTSTWKSGLRPTLCKVTQNIGNYMQNLKLPLKSSSSFQSFCISMSFLSVSGALYILLAPLKISSPVGCRLNRKLRSNGLKLSLFDLSFKCWRVCSKMQILQDVSMLINYMLLRTLGRSCVTVSIT